MLLFLLFATVSASFLSCKSEAKGLPVLTMRAEPDGRVDANQKTSFHISFVVPEGSQVLDGTVEITTRWSIFPAQVQRMPLADYTKLPLMAGHNSFDYEMLFPTGIWGSITADISVRNISGTQLLCARWSVYATGR